MPHRVLTAGIKRVGMGRLSLAFPGSVKAKSNAQFALH
jgi:hypothetical protein